MIVWYVGLLDVGTTINPVRLRGYDAVGNLLYTIRTNDFYPHSWTTTAERGALESKDLDIVDGYTHLGEAITFVRGADYPPAMQYIKKIAVDTSGWIYCAMGHCEGSQIKLRDGVTADQVWARRNQGIAGEIFSAPTNYRNAPNSYFLDLIENEYYPTYSYYKKKYIDFFRVYRQNGDRVDFPAVHGRPLSAVAVDSSGYIYIAGDPDGVSEIFLRKLDRTGTEIWSVGMDRWWYINDFLYQITLGGTVYTYLYVQWHEIDILLDGGGNIYLSGYRNSSQPLWGDSLYDGSHNSGWIRKYNSSGVLQWEIRFPNHGVSNLATDGTYFYVATHGYSTNFKTGHHSTQYNIDGTDYYFNVDESPADISVWDANGNLVDNFATPYTESSGVFTAAHYGIRRLNYRDGLLFCSSPKTNTLTDQFVFIYDVSDWSEQSLVPANSDYYYSTNGNIAANFIFDSSDNQYFAHTYQTAVYGVDEVPFNVYNSSGTRIWTTKSALGDTSGLTDTEKREPMGWTTNHVYIVQSPELPSIDLGVSLAIPSWQGDYYSSVGSLALAISLATPKLLRDYVGRPLPKIIRCYLSGTPDLELFLSSLSIRKNIAGYYLGVVCQLPNSDILNEINTRSAGDLIINYGVRLDDGTEQLEEMLRAALTDIRTDAGSSRISVTLQGSAVSNGTDTKTRAIYGISYRSTSSGKRRARCVIDPYLDVNDIADLGNGETMIIGEITININTTLAVMEIAEATT